MPCTSKCCKCFFCKGLLFPLSSPFKWEPPTNSPLCVLRPQVCGQWSEKAREEGCCFEEASGGHFGQVIVNPFSSAPATLSRGGSYWRKGFQGQPRCRQLFRIPSRLPLGDPHCRHSGLNHSLENSIRVASDDCREGRRSIVCFLVSERPRQGSVSFRRVKFSSKNGIRLWESNVGMHGVWAQWFHSADSPPYLCWGHSSSESRQLIRFSVGPGRWWKEPSAPPVPAQGAWQHLKLAKASLIYLPNTVKGIRFKITLNLEMHK